jgi:hypothetical protein
VTHCGIDVSLRHVFPVALDLGEGRFLLPNGPLGVNDAVRWVIGHSPSSVSIDSPPKPNLGLLEDEEYRRQHRIDLRGGGTDRRVTEWRLGIGGCYSTRRNPEACQPWMHTGMELYEAMEAAGYSLDLGAGGALFEIHPTYGFRSLIATHSEGLRVECDPDRILLPKLPTGSLGHAQRIRLLELLCSRWHVEVDRRAHASVDWTDAMLGAALGALRDDGGTLAVAAPNAREGAIVVASEPLTGAVKALGSVAASTERARVQSRERFPRSRNRSPRDEATGMLLRLGADGLGALTQQQTLDSLAECENHSEIILPVGSRVGREWEIVAAKAGLTVLLAFGGRIRAELVVTRIVSSAGISCNPWPVAAAPHWFVGESLRLLDASDHDFLFWHGSEWQPGFTSSQSSWIRYRALVPIRVP